MSQSAKWWRLVRSVQGSRFYRAKFFKPVCLVAAIDLANEGALDPRAVVPISIIDRFQTYVQPHFPKRASSGWQPLWHLANDGLWSFFKDGRLGGPKAFKGKIQPRSRKAVVNNIDRMEIDPSFRPQWNDLEARGILRNEIIAMLWRDSEQSSRTFARSLFDPAFNERPDYWPSAAAMDEFVRTARHEQDLFESSPLAEPVRPPPHSGIDAEKIAAAVQRLTQDPLGAQFAERGDALIITEDNSGDDAAAAGNPVTQQLHGEVLRKLATFTDRAKRLDNQRDWTGVAALCDRLSDLLNRPTNGVAVVIGSIYSSTLELGSFLEFDNELRRSADADADPLEPGTRRALDDLVRTLAPWVRLFPTAREADDATGQFLGRASLLPTAEATVELAEVSHILRKVDADVLRGLFDAYHRGAIVGNKAGARGVSSTRNMVVAIACLFSSFYAGAVASDFATKSVLVQRAGTFLASAESEILALVEDMAADLRLALQGLIQLSPPELAVLPDPPSVKSVRRRVPGAQSS